MGAFNCLPTNVFSHRHLRALLIVSIVGCSTPFLASSSPQQPSTASGPSTARPANSASHYLRVTINPSTAKIIEGAVYGLDAELENVATVPITIDVEQIQLAVQPELAPPNVSCTWFYNAGANDKVPSPIVMQPGDHFTLFFDTGAKARPGALKDIPWCEADYWGRFRRRLDFVPGNFAFVVTGTFVFTPTPTSSAPGSTSTDPSTSTKPEEHYFTETASLPVTIDQAQMILYAGIGGLMAFLVMSFRKASTLSEYAGKVQATSDKPPPKLLIILREAAAAILLSITVTVVAGRLSTTSFPVKVSVDDFWGALTVGFVSYFIGGKFIDKLSQGATSGSQPGPPTPAPVPTPVTPPPAKPPATEPI